MPPETLTDPRKPQYPRGLGLYARAMGWTTIKQRCQNMADHGVRWAAIFSIWQDVEKGTGKPTTRMVNNAEHCRRIAEEMLAAGIEPWLCGYPWMGREDEFVRVMSACSIPEIRGWIPDPELGLKDRDKDDDPTETFDDMARLFWACIKANPYRPVGITTYGFPKGHPTFPWGEFLVKGVFDHLREFDFNSPQLYDKTLLEIRRALTEYRELGADVLVPSFGTYREVRDPKTGERSFPRMNEEELTAHLQCFVDLKEEFQIPAVIGWSEPQLGKAGWRAIAKMAPLFD